MKQLVLVLAAMSLLPAGCALKPTVIGHKTMMTRAQIAAMGLDCKDLRPIDSNIPKTICASEKSWAAYNKRTRQATEELLAEGRKHGSH